MPDSDRYLLPGLLPLFDRLGVVDSDDLLCCYLDRAFRRNLGFLDRKRLSAALRQFTVGVPKKMAERIAHRAHPTEHDWLWVLDDQASYSDESGLAHILVPAEDELSYMLM